MQARFVSETEKISEAAAAAGHPVSAGIPPADQWADIGLPNTTAYHYSATIGTKSCTQVAMGICQIRAMDSGRVKYQVMMMQNRIPLEVMKKPPETLTQADSSKVTSHTILSQEFDNPEAAIDYFNEAKPLADNGSIFTYMQNTPAPAAPVTPQATAPAEEPFVPTLTDVRNGFKCSIPNKNRLPRQRRGTTTVAVGLNMGVKMPEYIKDDALRLHRAQVSIQNSGTTSYTPTTEAGKIEEGVAAFASELVSQLPEHTYGTREKRTNIANNVLSKFTPNIFADELSHLTGPKHLAGFMEDKDLTNMPPGTTATSYSAQVYPDQCVCVAMGICALTPYKDVQDDHGRVSQIPDPTKRLYKVIAIQNTIPTSGMQQEDLGGTPVQSRTLTSHLTFTNLEDALNCLNQAKPFAEDGSLFDVGFAALRAPVVEYRAPEAVKEKMLEGRGWDKAIPEQLKLGEETLSNLQRRGNVVKVKIGEFSEDYHPAQTEAEEQAQRGLKTFGQVLFPQLKEAVYGDEQTKQTILNNLVSGFDSTIFHEECTKRKGKPGCENLEHTIDSVHCFANLDTQHGTQVMRSIVKEESPQPTDGSPQRSPPRFAVVTLQNRMPLEILKQGVKELQERKTLPGVESHVVWSQSFATEAEAEDYMNATQADVERGTFVANLMGSQANFPMKVENQGPRTMLALLLDKERGEAPPAPQDGSFEIPGYIFKDTQRRSHLGIRIQGEALEQCTSAPSPKAGKPEELQAWINQQDVHFKEFTTKVLGKLESSNDSAIYGNKQAQQNIVQNVSSLLGQKTLLAQVNRMTEDSMQNGQLTVAIHQVNGSKLSELSNNQIPEENSTRASYATIDPQHCTQTQVGILSVNPYNVNGIPSGIPKYQVIIVQNRAPLEVMKKSYQKLQDMKANNDKQLEKLESRTTLSKLFDTPQEALAYYNQVATLAEAGTLLKGVDFTPTVADVKRDSASQRPIDRGAAAMKDILAPGEKIMLAPVGKKALQIPTYITKDFDRNDMQVSIQNQGQQGAPLEYQRGGGGGYICRSVIR